VPTVVYRTATSLDGFIADQHHSLDWLFAVDLEGAPAQEQFLAGVGVLVEGSATYEWVLRQTDVLTRPAAWQEFYGRRPTFVFTSRELSVPEGADVRFVHGPVEHAMPAIRDAAGERDIWVVGGGDLAAQFADAGLLDRLELSVAPVALAAGAPVLPRRIEADRLSLVSAERRGQFAELAYKVATTPKSA
jgi:dihydrofolate reductase